MAPLARRRIRIGGSMDRLRSRHRGASTRWGKSEKSHCFAMGAVRLFPHGAKAVRMWGSFRLVVESSARWPCQCSNIRGGPFGLYAILGPRPLGFGGRPRFGEATWPVHCNLVVIVGACRTLFLVGGMPFPQALLRSSCNFGASLAGALPRAQSCKFGHYDLEAMHGGCTGLRAFDSTLCSETRLRLLSRLW